MEEKSINDFLNTEERESVAEGESEVLNNKHKKFKELLNNKNSSEAEMEIYKPKKLGKFTLKQGNRLFGLKKQISFFVNEEEYLKLKNKWLLKDFNGIIRIAQKDLNKFIDKILEDG